MRSLDGGACKWLDWPEHPGFHENNDGGRALVWRTTEADERRWALRVEVDSLRRRLEKAETERDLARDVNRSYVTHLAAAESVVAAIRDLHAQERSLLSDAETGYCATCGDVYPCQTIEAMEEK